MHTDWRNKRISPGQADSRHSAFPTIRERWIWQVSHTDVVVKGQCKEMGARKWSFKDWILQEEGPL